MKKYFYILILLCSAGQYAYADCNVANVADDPNPDCVLQNGLFGQAFTVCENGEWTTLTFNINSVQGSGTATVYTAEGEVANSGAASAQIEGTFTTAGAKTITVNRPVSNGGRYIWWVEISGGFSKMCYEVSTGNFGAADDYVHSIRESGGTANSGALRSSGVSSSRVGFGVGFAAVIVGAVASAPIPTLSQWGLLVMALLVLNLGLIFIRKKESILL